MVGVEAEVKCVENNLDAQCLCCRTKCRGLLVKKVMDGQENLAFVRQKWRPWRKEEVGWMCWRDLALNLWMCDCDL